MTSEEQIIIASKIDDLKLLIQDKFNNKEKSIVEVKLDGLKELLLEKFKSSDKALEHQYQIYVKSHQELDDKIDMNSSDIVELKKGFSNMEGKASQKSVFIAWGIGIIGLVIGVLGILLRKG